jgi:hypothetical protein
MTATQAQLIKTIGTLCETIETLIAEKSVLLECPAAVEARKLIASVEMIASAQSVEEPERFDEATGPMGGA